MFYYILDDSFLFLLFFFKSWIYWGDISLQNRKDFWYIICTLHRVRITPNSLFPSPFPIPTFAHLPQPSPSSPLAVTALLSVNMCYVYMFGFCFLANLFTFFNLVPLPLLLSDSCQSVPCIHASVSIFLSVCFLH